MFFKVYHQVWLKSLVFHCRCDYSSIYSTLKSVYESIFFSNLNYDNIILGWLKTTTTSLTLLCSQNWPYIWRGLWYRVFHEPKIWKMYIDLLFPPLISSNKSHVCFSHSVSSHRPNNNSIYSSFDYCSMPGITVIACLMAGINLDWGFITFFTHTLSHNSSDSTQNWIQGHFLLFSSMEPTQNYPWKS